MLSRLKAKNFKSIGDPGIDLELKPLTILVGPNGSGKSSILEVPALLSQSVRGEFNIRGELATYESPSEVVHKQELQRWVELEVDDRAAAGVRWGMKYATGEQWLTALSAGREVMTAKLVGDTRTGLRPLLELPDGRTQPAPGMPFLEKRAFSPGGESWPECDTAQRLVGSISSELFERVFLLSDRRGFIERSKGSTGFPRWVGTRGDRLIELLTLLNIPGDEKNEKIWPKIVSWAERFDLAKVWAGPSVPSGGGAWAATYRDPALGCNLNLALAGHGSRQVISVIAQLFYSPPGSLILVEEPELSLHPQSQVMLCELFADAISESKQIIITTHSSYALLSISNAVGHGKLSSNDVAVYEITKTPDGTQSRQMKVTEEGYVEGWIASFARAERELLSDWLVTLKEEA